MPSFVPAANASGRRGWGSALGLGLCLVVITYLAHFWLSGSFGFYEDDYRGTAPWMGLSNHQLWAATVSVFRLWPQGRPLNHLLPGLLGAYGYRLDGVRGMYLLGFAGLALNALLVAGIARRLYGGVLAGFLAGVFYVLYPADTTRELLTHCGHVQASMTFFLIGALLLLGERGWRYLAYPVAFLSLLSYETAYLLFLAFPLLQARPNRRYAWRLGGHVALCALSILAVVVVRLFHRDDRMVKMVGHPAQSFFIVLVSPFFGFETSAARLATFAWDAVANASAGGVAMGAVIAALVGATLWWLAKGAGAGPAPPATSAPRTGSALLGESGLTVAGYVVVLLAQWMFSYCLSFVNFPPTAVVGRFTSVHVAAAFPVSLLGTLLVLRALAGARDKTGASWAVKTLVTLYCGLAGLYTFTIQRGYAMAWVENVRYYRQIFALSPELWSGGTVIVYGAIRQDTSMAGVSPCIYAICQQNQRIANLIFNGSSEYLPPKSQKSPAYVVFLQPPSDQPPPLGQSSDTNNFCVIKQTGGTLSYTMNFENEDNRWFQADPDKLVLLRNRDGRLTRVGALEIPGLAAPLRARATPPPGPTPGGPATRKPLYRALQP